MFSFSKEENKSKCLFVVLSAFTDNQGCVVGKKNQKKYIKKTYHIICKIQLNPEEVPPYMIFFRNIIIYLFLQLLMLFHVVYAW